MRLGGELVRELTIRLQEADELFVAPGPDVASGVPPVPPGIEQIRSELGSRTLPAAVVAEILLPRHRVRPDLAANIGLAVNRYCGIAQADNELRAMRREGLRWLAIAIIMYAVFVSLAAAIVRSSAPETVRDVFGDDGLFIVVAWVVLWYPLDTLLYSGRPYRLEKSVLHAMHGMRIVIRADEGGTGGREDPPGASPRAAPDTGRGP
jgi:hypothetical protein